MALIYVYKDRGVNGNLEICKKKSFYWYKKFIVNNTKILRNRKGLFEDITKKCDNNYINSFVKGEKYLVKNKQEI